MEKLIRTMIKESFYELREDGFAQDVLGRIEHDGHEGIIGDRSSAVAFANNELTKDIPELSNYELVSYLPGIDSEKWTFDADTSTNFLNTIEIRHSIKNDTSFWNFIFGQAEKSMEAMTSEVHYKTGNIAGYDAFVEKVNSDWQEWG